MSDQWREVTKDEFYREIGPQNVTPYPTGNFPYVSLYKLPDGRVCGKAVDGKRHGDTKFYLPDTRFAAESVRQ
tara:strand:- start:1319 stop:1537 length:219 start_codon:yes stop_codon:yes gene_type:complete